GKAVFDPHIAALDKTSLGETLTERRQIVRSHPRRPAVEKPDDWHCRLLRARRERPCCRRAAEQSDEFAADQSMTSSARASSVGGTSRPSALAVVRLMTSSYLVGACTGRSAGFSPLRMRST